MSLFHLEDMGKFSRDLSVSSPASAVLRVARHDTGEPRWLQAWGQRFGDPQCLGTRGIVLDITERERTASRSRESDRRLAAASSLAGLATWSHTFARNTTVWSEGMYAMYGTGVGSVPSAAEILSRTHPDDRPALDAAVRDLNAGRGPVELVVRINGDDATIRWHRAWLDSTQDGDGTVTGMWGVTQDITERETAAAALRSSAEQFRIAFDNAPTGMTLVDLQAIGPMRSMRANASFWRMLGYAEPPETIDIADLTHPDDREISLAKLAALLDGRLDRTSFEKRYCTATGTSSPADSRSPSPSGRSGNGSGSSRTPSTSPSDGAPRPNWKRSRTATRSPASPTAPTSTCGCHRPSTASIRAPVRSRCCCSTSTASS